MNATPIDVCRSGANDSARPMKPRESPARDYPNPDWRRGFSLRAKWWLRRFLFLTCIVPLPGAVSAAPLAIVQSMVGNCELRSLPTTSTSKPKVGQEIEPGQELRCSPGGKLTFSFRGQAVLKLIDGDSPTRNSYIVPAVPLSVPESSDNRGGLVSIAEPTGSFEDASGLLLRILASGAGRGLGPLDDAQTDMHGMALSGVLMKTTSRSPRTLKTCVYRGDRSDALACTQIQCPEAPEPKPNICRMLNLPEVGHRASGALAEQTAPSRPSKYGTAK